MFGLPNMCIGCIHYDRNDYGEQETCTAFPTGIPQDILDGASHWDPYPNDNGVTFWPRDDGGDLLKQYVAFWYVPQGEEGAVELP